MNPAIATSSQPVRKCAKTSQTGPRTRCLPGGFRGTSPPGRASYSTSASHHAPARPGVRNGFINGTIVVVEILQSDRYLAGLCRSGRRRACVCLPVLSICLQSSERTSTDRSILPSCSSQVRWVGIYPHGVHERASSHSPVPERTRSCPPVRRRGLSARTLEDTLYAEGMGRWTGVVAAVLAWAVRRYLRTGHVECEKAWFSLYCVHRVGGMLHLFEGSM